MSTPLAVGAPQRSLRLVGSGMAVVAVAFGLARYGYGLLLPEMRRDLGLGRTELGLIGSAAYVSYLLATLAVGQVIIRVGLRGTVALAGACGAGGMLLVAVASDPALLAAGVFVAGAAPGLVWPPYIDAVEQRVSPARRDSAHALINSGTAYGVAVAAPIALLAAGQWRLAWVAFAACAVVATIWAVTSLPRRERTAPAADAASEGLTYLTAASRPLFTLTFVLGVTAGAYWTFGVDAVVERQLLAPAGGQLFLVVVGLCGLVGGVVGRLAAAVGTPVVLAGTVSVLAVGQVALALAGGPLLTLLSAALFGAGFIGVVGVAAIWAAVLFPQRPSSGLAASMFCMGVGYVIGPAAAGVLADVAGLPAVFWSGGAATAALLLLAPRVPSRRH